MKLSAITFLLLLSTLGATSQKLKMDVTANGDTILSTKEQKIYTQPGSSKSVAEMLKVYAFRNSRPGSPLLLSFYIQTGRTSVFTIAPGASIELTLQNGNTVKLYTRNGNQSKRLVSNYGCFIYISYTLPEAEAKLLQASPIRNIRVDASIGPMDYEIKEKFSKDIGELVGQF